MRKTFSLVGVVLALLLALALMAQAQPAKSGNYGPCCPLVKGRTQPKATMAGGQKALAGPRHICETKPISITYDGATHAVDMIEVTGSLLAPARMLMMTGADLEWGGQRHFMLIRGARRVELTLGSHAVTISNGSDTKMVSWPLCPRLLNNISYVPLRPTAEALGLDVAFENGVVTLTETGVSAETPVKAAQCPADRVEEALGATIIRAPAESALGVGTGILEIKPDALAAGMGLRAKDVIVEANGKRVNCPKDLDDLLTSLKADNGTIKTLVVVRGKEKITLQNEAAQ